MEIKIVKWSEELKDGLISVCNNTDRSYLTDRLPYPYTEKDADRWLAMVKEHDGKDSLFRAPCPGCDKRFCGKGIATKAAELIVKEAFATLDIVKISSEVFAPNIASKRVLEKNGFALEGVLKDAAYKNGVIYDLCRYGKLKN